MGDRANVVIDDSGERVYLYTHWGGMELPQVVQGALAKRQRWDDAPYLARIVFCAMVKGQEDEETGYGISTSPPDNEHPLIVLDCRNKKVKLEAYGGGFADPLVGREWTFEEFVALDVAKELADF